MAAENQPDNVIAFSGNTMVYESIKRFAVKGLNELIRSLMENIDDALFDLSDKVESDHERNRYFDAMREIRLKRKNIEQDFDAEMQQCFADLLLENKPRQAARASSSDELSLVAHDEVEDQIAIDNMVRKARPRFEDDLFALTARLREVLRRSRIDAEQNPLDPRPICNSFHQACKGLDADIQVKLILYKMFDRFVVSRLGDFYLDVNDYCIEKGILADLKPSEERIKHSGRFASRRASQTQKTEVSPHKGEDDSTAFDMESVEAGGGLLTALRQLFGPITGGAPAAGAGAAPAMMDGAVGAEGGAVGGGVALNPAYAGAFSGLQAAVLSAPSGEALTPAEVRNTTHQQLVDFRNSIGSSVNPADSQVIDIVSMLFDFFFDDEALPDPIKVHIGRMQIPILKLAMIDPNFFNQKKHPARQLLDLFSHASMGWSENFQEEKVLVDKIEEIVNYLLDEFDQDVEVFETALNRFKEFIAEEQEKADAEQRTIDAEEKQRDARLRQADQEVSAFVQKMLRKHEMSFTVSEFLEGIWSNVMRSALVSEGRESPHWKNLKRVTTTLVWTLIPKHTEEDKGKLLNTLPSLLRALSRGMELVQTDSDSQNRVFKMLVLEHSKVVKQTSRNIVTRVDDHTVWPKEKVAAALGEYGAGDSEDVDIEIGENADGDITIVSKEEEESAQAESLVQVSTTPARQVVADLDEFTASVSEGQIEIDEEIVLDSTQPEFDRTRQEQVPDDEFSEAARTLEVGDWVRLTDERGKMVNAKLSWKSNVTGKYVFVNRHGAKIRKMTANGLALELRAGRVELAESISLFDRAVHSLVNKMR